MPKNILIRPVISEKAEAISEAHQQYTFVVDKKANKVEIRKAVERMYNVAVDSVNTMIMPGKAKKIYTRAGVQSGSVGAYKKAIVTLVEGEEIDFFGDI